MDGFLNLIVLIPQEMSEDITTLPLSIKLHSKDDLAALKNKCLAILAEVIGSRSLQNGVTHAFAIGDVSFIANDYFSPIVEQLLVLSSTNRKGISFVDGLTLDNAALIHVSLDGVFGVLPLQWVADIVGTFLETKTDVRITSSMITIASDRLARDAVTLVALKPALSRLLSLLNDIVQSADDVEATRVALGCIGKLSRVHGKTELPLFETIVPAIVSRGIGNESRIVKEQAVNCLFAMLYVHNQKLLILGLSWEPVLYHFYPISYLPFLDSSRLLMVCD
jgi:hypothetical protein